MRSASSGPPSAARTTTVRSQQRTIQELEPGVGAVAVRGPGLVIVVDDAPSSENSQPDRVYDVDLQILTNGLWQAGAEAVAINGHRLSALTAIRGAGEAITVDYPFADPPVPGGGHRRCADPAGPFRRVERRELVERAGPEPGVALRHRDRGRADPPRGCRPRAPPRRAGELMLPLIGLLAGIAIGLLLEPSIPAGLQPYLPIAIVAAMDALFGGLRAYLEGNFSDKVFAISFVSNVLIAAAIVWVGDQIGVGAQLSTGVVVVLGIRIFTNAAAIRRALFHA